MSNVDEVERGFKSFRAKLEQQLITALTKSADQLLTDALSKKGFKSFTGNTATSYGCGIYKNGKLDTIVLIGDKMPDPVHVKVKKGEVVFLEEPYEGNMRKVKGSVNIVYDTSGENTARILLNQANIGNDMFTLVMLTGTEYSQYLEAYRKLNVLADTSEASNVKNIVLPNIQQAVK